MTKRKSPFWPVVILLVGLHAQAAGPLDGTRVRHILVSRSALPVDVPAPGVYSPVGFYVLDGLIAGALIESQAKRQREDWRRDIADLSGDPLVVAWMDRFQLDLGATLLTRFGADGAVAEDLGTHERRQKREVELAPEQVISALVLNQIRPQRDCGSIGFAISYGSGYMKKTKDIKRRPINVYVPQPERTQVMVSEWCLPGSRTSYRTNKEGGQRIASAGDLIAVLDERKHELLEALANPPTGDIDGARIATIVPRERPFYVVAYGRERSWIASTDHQLLRLVPNNSLEDILCSNACGPLERAQAEERARRSKWESEHGPLTFD